MKISFVIPAYNEENHLKACLDSIFQELSGKSLAWEIIVVNNASTDQTKNIAQTYSQVKVVDEPRKGLSFARQAGFAASSGELVANVDADTIMPQGWLDKVIKYYQTTPNLVCLSGPHVFYDMPVWFNWGVKGYYYIVYALYLFNRFVLRVGSMVQGGNFVLKRAALAGIGGFDTDFNFYGEDANIAKRLNKVGQVIFTLRLPIGASGRRVKAEGFLLTPLRYGINYIWTVFFGHPFHKKHSDIRSR
jgi:glycosyltransferase involved in cell wall biosynthesis